MMSIIDAYILNQDKKFHEELFKLKSALLEVLVDCEEKISYGMPTFWKKKNICHFALNKNHIGFYPGPMAIETFSSQLSKYKTSKGAIQIPFGKLDVSLIQSIASWCLKNYI